MSKRKRKLIVAKDLPTLYTKMGIKKGDQQNIVKLIKRIWGSGGIKEISFPQNKGIRRYNKKGK